MSGRDERARRIGLRILLILGLLFLALPALGGPSGRLVPSPSGGSDVEWALAEASALAELKLQDSSCREIFSEFRDSRGRPLAENLEAAGFDGIGYLRGRLLFYSGYGRPACATRDTIAFTSPGSAVVFVCSQQFVEKTHRDPGFAADLLIHEELHSLGLGENPPASKEITARVIQRCGK